MDKLVIAYQCRPIFPVSRYKSEIRSIQRSEIALKKNLIHHPRVIIRFLLPLKTLFSVCFSRLFFLFFSIPPTLSNNYTFSSPLSTPKKGKEESQGMYNRVIQLRLSTWSNRIVTRPIVNNSRNFNLSPRLQQRGARGPAAIALERPPLSHRLSQTRGTRTITNPSHSNRYNPC